MLGAQYIIREEAELKQQLRPEGDLNLRMQESLD